MNLLWGKDKSIRLTSYFSIHLTIRKKQSNRSYKKERLLYFWLNRKDYSLKPVQPDLLKLQFFKGFAFSSFLRIADGNNA